MAALLGTAAAPGLAMAVDLTEPGHFSNGSEVPALTDPGESSLGSGSWKADPNLTGSDGKQHLIYVQGDQAGPFELGGQVSYPAPGANPRLLFPSDQNVTLGDITSISWDTKTSGPNDWFVDIFTKPDGVDDDAWYGKNFDLTANNAANSPGNGGFETHSFGPGGGAAYDDADLTDGGGLSLLTLGDLQGTYGSEEIWFVALGTATNYDGFGGNLDNVRFNYSYNGQDYNRVVDFEASEVPVPSSAGLLVAALLSLGWLACGRRSAGRLRG